MLSLSMHGIINQMSTPLFGHHAIDSSTIENTGRIDQVACGHHPQQALSLVNGMGIITYTTKPFPLFSKAFPTSWLDS